jgi:hypothetical protein
MALGRGHEGHTANGLAIDRGPQPVDVVGGGADKLFTIKTLLLDWAITSTSPEGDRREAGAEGSGEWPEAAPVETRSLRRP